MKSLRGIYSKRHLKSITELERTKVVRPHIISIEHLNILVESEQNKRSNVRRANIKNKK